jgi:hypothetical protein
MYSLLINLLSPQSIPVAFRICINLVDNIQKILKHIFVNTAMEILGYQDTLERNNSYDNERGTMKDPELGIKSTAQYTNTS